MARYNDPLQTYGISQEFGGPITGEIPAKSIISSGLDYAKEFAPVIDPSATTERRPESQQPQPPRPTVTPPVAQPGPIAQAASKISGDSGVDLTNAAGGLSPEDAAAKLAGVRADLATYKQGEQDQLNRRDASIAHNAQLAQNYTDRRRAEGDARVAGARARGGVFGGPSFGGVNAEQATAILDAARTSATVDRLNGQATALAGVAPAPGTRNFIQEAAAGQAARTGAAESAQKLELGKTNLNEAKQKLEVQSRINQLGKTLADPNADPKARESASAALLAHLGKDKPEEYQVIHAPGGTSIGPDGFTPVKHPDNVVIVNKRTGTREVVQLGQGAAAQAAPPENHVLALKQDPAKYKAQFEAKYGKGAADQYLAK